MNLRRLLMISMMFLMPVQGFAGAAQEQEFLQRIRDELLLQPLDAALGALEVIETSLANSSGASQRASLIRARQAFADLVWNWKAAQAIYVAGVLDDELVDHPQIVDHFHQGKESLSEVVDAVLSSERELQQAMFKTSARSINALEYLLFAEDTEDSPRRRQAALLAATSIGDWLSEVEEYYRYSSAFVDGGEASLEKVIHALVDSSYRLASWRVGEPGGLVDKFEGRPSALRLEYFRSGLSMHAVESILRTHDRFFAIGEDCGYFSEQGRNKGLDVIGDIRPKIDQSLAIASRLAAARETDVTSADFRELHRLLDIVYRTYYYLLVDALGFEGKILDADGD